MSYIKDYEHLKMIVQNCEQDNIEYKDEQFLTNKNASVLVAKYVSGFANSEKGGSIIFGVSKNNELIGIDKTKLDIYKLKISDWIRHGISRTLFVDYYEIQKKDNSNLFFLIIDIYKSNLAPHQHIKDRIYYKREGSSIGSLSTQEGGKFIPLSEREIQNLYKDRFELRDALKKREQYILDNIILKFRGIQPFFFFLIQPVSEIDNFLLNSSFVREMILSINNDFMLGNISKNYFGIKIDFKKCEDNGVLYFQDKGEVLFIRTIPISKPLDKSTLDMDALYVSLGFFLKSYRSYYKKIGRNPQVFLKIGFVFPSKIIIPESKILGTNLPYLIDGIECKDYFDLDEMAYNLFEKISHWFGKDSFNQYWPKIKSLISESKDYSN